MDYPLEFRKFITSQYLFTGIRITAGVIIPAVLLYQWDVLPTLIAIPLGALFVSLTDNPGPPQHRRNGMLTSILLCFCVILITGFSRFSPLLIALEIAIFSILFSLIGIFGNRANAIGLVALIVFILHVDGHQGAQNIWMQGAFFVAGGIWYALLSLALYTLQPYRAAQQLLGECLMEMGEYFSKRARFYQRDATITTIYSDLFEHQVKIHQLQEDLREMLFSTRRFVNESTGKGRVLMMIFIDSVDLQERLMTAQQDYTQLHHDFDDSGILDQFYKNIKILSNTLHHIGLAVQEGVSHRSHADLDAHLQSTTTAFNELRKNHLNADNVEAFITLRHILYALQDLTDRIRRIERYTTFNRELGKEFKSQVDLGRFKPHHEISFDLFRANISMKSSSFRHALRLAIALLVGYGVSFLLPVGHGYWILLTIATIIRPAYSLTKHRNFQRLWGTLAGTVAGFVTVYATGESTPIFILMIISAVVSYSYLRINYGVSTAGLTLFLLLSFHFLDPFGFQEVLVERIIDTITGCTIAFIVSLFVLPTWEHEQIDNLISEAIRANSRYFGSVSQTFTSAAADVTTYKIHRKEAFVALANLSDTFQRMLSEPKRQKKDLQLYHQFVTSNHVLTSHIASLSYYAENFANEYRSRDFEPMISTINRQFGYALELAEGNVPEDRQQLNPFPIHKKVQHLLELRRKELGEGVLSNDKSLRKSLSDLKAITEQFRLVHATAAEQSAILGKLRSR